MKKNKCYYRLLELIFVIATSTVIGMLSGGAAIYSMFQVKDNTYIERNNDLEEVSNVYHEILNNYYKDVNKKDLIEGAIEGMLSKLDDPYSTYLNEDEKSSFDDRLNGEYSGLGIEIQNDSNGNILIVNVFEGSPASKANLKAGDIINKVNGVEVKGTPSEDVASSIKGSKEQVIGLNIIRNNSSFDVEIKRERITISSVTSKIFERNGKRVGYLYLSIFANNTYAQFNEALKYLEREKIDSLIIDVRSNSGGYLSIVSNMLELFLKKGDVLYQIEDHNGVTKRLDTTEAKRTYPIAVLTNEYSASASEILAAALKESYGAIIVGTTTYGKGTVQQTMDVGAGGMAKLTTQKWLTPNGNWIHEKGIVPTNEVKLSAEYSLNPSDNTDNQLQEAINLLAK